MDKKFGAFTSSTNSQELSLTITSIVKIAGLLIGSYASIKGVDAVITEPQLELISTAIITIATAVLTIIQSGELVFGIVRKALAKLNS